MKVLVSFLSVLTLIGVLYAESDPWGPVVRHGGSLDQRWGPDSYGYVARNQAEAGGPTAAWTDISSSGVRVTGTGDDNAVGPFDIGFNFHYYWYDVNRFWVGSNGYIKFSSRGQIASPFVQFPNVAPPNDVVGPYVADWVMAGNNSTDSVCYYWSNFSDTLIVMWKNIAAYTNGGQHNFEIILSAIDSSITFQYGTQTGSVTSGDAIGIENLNGRVGLNTLFGTYPTAASAIRFSYPDTISYATHFVMPVAVQNPLSNGFFIRTGDTLRPWFQVANLGNVVSEACSLRYYILHPNNQVVAEFDTMLSAMAAMDTLTITPSLQWVAADTGTYLLEAMTWEGGQPSLRTELHVVSLPGQLAYDDGISDRLSAWTSAGRAVANEFEPPVYPASISGVRAYFGTSGSAYDVSIIGNDGPGGTPGTEIWRHHFASATSGWNIAAVPPDSATIYGGGFYVAYWTPSGMQLGFDTTSTQGFSHRTWEFLNSWGQNKWWNIADAMIRCSLNPIYPPPGPFQRRNPVDASTIPWLQGTIDFRWTASHDSGTTVLYHLRVSSGDYTRNWATTDTTYSDSMYWCYLGNPRADVTWTVWATNGRDSVQATNGNGYFHLNANHAPGPFTRMAPPENTQYNTNQSPFTMRWTTSTDADNDPVTYLLTIVGRDSSLHHDTTMHFVSIDTVFTSDLHQIWPRGFPHITNVRWSVSATDGMDTTAASNNPGHFTLVTTVAADERTDLLPKEYALSSYPNPFNSTAMISYEVPQTSVVELKIFNLAGEEVAVLHKGSLAPGRYRAEWNAGAQSSGTYFAVMKAGSQTKIQKLMLLK